jgi:hypothetical protein
VVLALCFSTALLASGAPPACGEARVVDLAIRSGQLTREAQVVRVPQGDDVTLLWTTDAPLTVHVHGYDLETRVTPGTPVAMRFTARAAGRFPIAVHGHERGGERTLGYLEVHPR